MQLAMSNIIMPVDYHQGLLHLNKSCLIKEKMEVLDNLNIANKYTLDLSLWLDDYDDIYSDFDSRNYLKRRVSDDFVNELRISLKNKNEKINDLILLVPQAKRDNKAELKIIQNLKNYFTRHLHLYSQKYNKNLKRGILFFIIAILLMIGNAAVSLQLNNNLLSSIIRIVLEPAGWFLIWISFDILYYDLHEVKKEKLLFRELSEIMIYFQSSDSYIANE